MDQTGAKVRATKSHRNFSQRMHLIHPRCTLNTCFGVFCTIWMYLEPFGCLTKLDAKRVEMVQKFVPWSRVGIFHNRPLDPPYRTLTSCFGAFCTIWVHLRLLVCLTKLGAKQAKLVQKFMPRSRVGIFRSERILSTPLEPKRMFWSISYYLGAFGTVWLPYKTRCKTGQTSAKVHATKSRLNFSQRMRPIHPIGP